jgi:phage shock protein A
MGIFSRFSTLVRSNLNDLIARAENPEKMLNQVIDDMRNQLARARQEVAHAMADAAKLKKQVEDEQKQAHDWEQRAMLAVRQGRDDLARQALMRQEEHAARAQTLYETWQKHEADTQRLRDALRQLSDKIQEAQRKKNLLIAQHKRAEAQKRIHDTMSGLSDTSAFEAFDRMAQRVEDSERQAIAAATVTEELTGDSLEREFKALETGGPQQVDYKLLEMKQRMGLLGGGSAAQSQLQLGTGGADAAPPTPAASAGSAPALPKAPAEGAPAGDVSEAELVDEFEALEAKERERA